MHLGWIMEVDGKRVSHVQHPQKRCASVPLACLAIAYKLMCAILRVAKKQMLMCRLPVTVADLSIHLNDLSSIAIGYVMVRECMMRFV